MNIKQYLLIAIVFLVTGCSSLNDEQTNKKRHDIMDMAHSTIDKLIAQDQKLHQSFEQSLGYLVVNMKVTKIPAIGVGSGEGMLLLKAENQPIFYSVQRFDLGAGWGARSYKVLVLLNSQDLIDELKDGYWVFDIGGEASAGSTAVEGASSGMTPEYSVHVLSDGGVSASITARAIRISKSNLN